MLYRRVLGHQPTTTTIPWLAWKSSEANQPETKKNTKLHEQIISLLILLGAPVLVFSSNRDAKTSVPFCVCGNLELHVRPFRCLMSIAPANVFGVNETETLHRAHIILTVRLPIIGIGNQATTFLFFSLPRSSAMRRTIFSGIHTDEDRCENRATPIVAFVAVKQNGPDSSRSNYVGWHSVGMVLIGCAPTKLRSTWTPYMKRDYTTEQLGLRSSVIKCPSRSEILIYPYIILIFCVTGHLTNLMTSSFFKKNVRFLKTYRCTS